MTNITELTDFFASDEAFVLLDPRETGVFARAHILGSTNVPLSVMEIQLVNLVPNRQTKIIVVADDPRIADLTLTRLVAMHYENVSVLEGGIAAWGLAGYVLFSGANVLSKAFGEFVEAKLHTPSISASKLKHWQDTNQSFILLDGRTKDEHQNYCIPGAMHCANADLPRATQILRKNPEIPVVVHCAGRTRSIIGCQVLIDSGLENSVFALENGTIDWLDAGFSLEYGADRPFDFASTEVTQEMLIHTQSLANDFDIVELSAAQLDLQDQSFETIYRFDIRSPHEFKKGSLTGTVNVPGGQLVQATDKYIAVRNAAIILLDDDSIRAKYTAIWLRRMGWKNIFTYCLSDSDYSLPQYRMQHVQGEYIDSTALVTKLNDPDICILDLRRSPDYYRQHIPGAAYFSRPIDGQYDALQRDKTFVLVASTCLQYTDLVATEIAESGRGVVMLEGGMQAWLNRDLPIENINHQFLSYPVDVVPDPEDYGDSFVVQREGKRYLRWEIELIDLIANEPAARFSV